MAFLPPCLAPSWFSKPLLCPRPHGGGCCWARGGPENWGRGGRWAGVHSKRSVQEGHSEEMTFKLGVLSCTPKGAGVGEQPRGGSRAGLGPHAEMTHLRATGTAATQPDPALRLPHLSPRTPFPPRGITCLHSGVLALPTPSSLLGPLLPFLRPALPRPARPPGFSEPGTGPATAPIPPTFSSRGSLPTGLLPGFLQARLPGRVPRGTRLRLGGDTWGLINWSASVSSSAN